MQQYWHQLLRSCSRQLLLSVMQGQIAKYIFLYSLKLFFKAISILQLLYTVLKYFENASLWNWIKESPHFQDMANLICIVHFPPITLNTVWFVLGSCILLNIWLISPKFSGTWYKIIDTPLFSSLTSAKWDVLRFIKGEERLSLFV